MDMLSAIENIHSVLNYRWAEQIRMLNKTQ